LRFARSEIIGSRNWFALLHRAFGYLDANDPTGASGFAFSKTELARNLPACTNEEKKLKAEPGHFAAWKFIRPTAGLPVRRVFEKLWRRRRKKPERFQYENNAILIAAVF